MAVQSTWIKNTDGSSWDVGTCPNSGRIVYPASAALADLMDTIEDFIGDHGWVLYNSTLGTNLRGYRALNADGTTYKYMGLDFNTSNTMFVKCWESFTTSGSSVTNAVAWNTISGLAQRVDLTNGGDMYIAVDTDYCVFQSVVAAGTGSSTGSAWAGVLEVSRDNAEDTGSVPCHFLANGSPFFDTQSSYYTPCGYPRTGLGKTGNNAATYTGFISDFGYSGMVPGTNTYSPLTGTGNFSLAFLSRDNNWSSKKWVSDMVSYTFTTTSTSTTLLELRGRIRKAKLVTSGGLMDEASIKVDTDGYLDPAGTATTHISFTTSGSARLYLPK